MTTVTFPKHKQSPKPISTHVDRKQVNIKYFNTAVIEVILMSTNNPFLRHYVKFSWNERSL